MCVGAQRAACEGRGVAAEKLFSAEDITADPERVAPCVLELQALEAAAAGCGRVHPPGWLPVDRPYIV